MGFRNSIAAAMTDRIVASAQGFLYAYVCFLLEDVCLVLISGSSEEFYDLKDCKRQIYEGLLVFVHVCRTRES